MTVYNLTCLFCEEILSFKDGQLDNLTSHIEVKHMVVSRKDLVLAFIFLSNIEIRTLSKILKPRIEHFVKRGEILENRSNIFKDEMETEDYIGNEGDLKLIQDELLSDIESDSDDEQDSTQKDSVDDLKFIQLNIQQELDNSSSDEEVEKDLPKKVKSKEYLGESLISSSFPIKPCFIHIKKLTDINNKYASKYKDSNSHNRQQEVEGFTNSKLKGEEKDKFTEGLSINNINLVDKLKKLNQCRLCFSRFTNKPNLMRHEKKVHKDDQEALVLKFFYLKDLVHSCEGCPQIPGFLTENSLKIHKEMRHRPKKRNATVTCDVCEKVLKYYNFKIHMRIHRNKKVGVNKKLNSENNERFCQHCNLWYKQPKYLKRHNNQVHKNGLPTDTEVEELWESCTSCDKKFISVKALDFHTKKKHKKFNCDVCHVSFANNNNLKVHLKGVHKIEKNLELFDGGVDESLLIIKCDKCEKRFANESILKYHKKYKHVETMSYCKLCDEVFKFPSLFKRHKIVTHKDDFWAFDTNLDPNLLNYPCSNCSLKFLSENLLKYHKKLKHKENLDILTKMK